MESELDGDYPNEIQITEFFTMESVVQKEIGADAPKSRRWG
jgi:hypothetical protein